MSAARLPFCNILQLRGTAWRPCRRGTTQSVGKELGRTLVHLRTQRRGSAQGERPRNAAKAGSDSQEARPTRNPVGDGRRPQRARNGLGPMARWKAQELHSLTKPAADLNPDDNQMADRACQVRRRSRRAALVTAKPGRTSACGCAMTCQGGKPKWQDQSGMPKREGFRDNLDEMGTSTFDSCAKRTWRTTLAPASRHTRATACSRDQGTRGRDARPGAPWSPRSAPWSPRRRVALLEYRSTVHVSLS